MKITDVTLTRVPLPPQRIARTWNSIVQQEASGGTRQRYGSRLEVHPRAPTTAGTSTTRCASRG